MKTPTLSADVYAGMKVLPRAPDPRYNTGTESKHGVKMFGCGRVGGGGWCPHQQVTEYREPGGVAANE